MTTFKALSELLKDDMRSQIKLLKRMTQCARNYLPPQIATHCWVGGYNIHELQLVTDHSIFAPAIYYRQKKVIDKINEQFSKELGIKLTKASITVSKYPIE